MVLCRRCALILAYESTVYSRGLLWFWPIGRDEDTGVRVLSKTAGRIHRHSRRVNRFCFSLVVWHSDYCIVSVQLNNIPMHVTIKKEHSPTEIKSPFQPRRFSMGRWFGIFTYPWLSMNGWFLWDQCRSICHGSVMAYDSPSFYNSHS